MGTIIFQFITFGLVVLFVVSFILFVRRLLVNSAVKNNQFKDIEKKLDKIIELMEMDEKH